MHSFIKNTLIGSAISIISLQTHSQPVEVFEFNQPTDLDFSSQASPSLRKNDSLLDVDDEECFRTRAFVEIGSSNLKLTMGKVDVCQEKTMPPSVFFTVKRTLNLKALQLPDGSMPEVAINLLLIALKDMRLMAILESSDNIEWAVIATASLRGLTNQEKVIAQVKKLFGMEIAVIAQEEEAKFSWLSAEQLAGEELHAVMDTGGGSFQVLIRTNNPVAADGTLPSQEDYLEIFGNIGTTAVKKFFREMTAREDFFPLSSQAQMAIEEDQCIPLKNVCQLILDSISFSKQSETTLPNQYIQGLTHGHKLFGVSRSFVFSILPLIVSALNYDFSLNPLFYSNEGEGLLTMGQEKVFTLKQLRRAITILSPMTSERIRAIAPSAKDDPWGDFSNMVLVYVVLQYLGMDEVRVLEVTSSLQGALAGLESKWITGKEMHDIIWKKAPK
jgi:hypothetical protein